MILLERYSEEELHSRWQELARGLRDNTPHWGSRAYDLDPIPGFLSDADWKCLEAGLIQRAEVLNAALEDVYGQQLGLRQGILPPSMIHNNPAWLPACHGMVDSHLARLVFYAADVVRDEQGRWWVMRDRTQQPAGFGTLLHNRRWMARAYHEIFTDHRVQPIAPAFQGLRRTLGEIGHHNPVARTVMLTKAVGSPGSSDDAGLAQFLGCALVEGEDLTVRGGALYLKLLEGLLPVDVVLRRVPDSICDPLEIPTSQWGGVAALLQAVRAGNVVVSNSLGSGWLESPALAAQLEGLSQLFFDKELMLPSLPAHWANSLPELDGDWVARPFAGGPPVLLAEHTSSQRQAWLEECQPKEWVFQRYCKGSLFACWRAGSMQQLPGVVRCFLVSTPEGYRMLPGGMVHMNRSGSPLRLMKDLWRPSAGQSSGSPRSRSLGPPLVLGSGPSNGVSRGGGDIPSRVAEQFYWFGRYLERCESLVRFARVILQKRNLNEEQESVLDQDLGRLLSCRPELGQDLRAWAGGKGDDQLQSLLQHLLRLGGSLSDRLSGDLHQAMGALPLLTQPLEAGRSLLYLESLSLPIWALLGVARESLYRGYGFRFLEIGRHYERALQTTELLRDVEALRPGIDIQEVLLDVLDSGRTYRRRYPNGLEWTGLVDLLLADETHPRSVAYQLRALDEHFEHLPNRDQVGLAAHRRALLRARASLQLWQAPEPTPIEDVARFLPGVSSALASVYLTHVRPSYQRGAQ